MGVNGKRNGRRRHLRSTDGGHGEKEGVLIGSHLCGRLSVQAVDLFAAIGQVSGLVISPCCWPRLRDYNSGEQVS